jgi:hypothetical protein
MIDFPPAIPFAHVVVSKPSIICPLQQGTTLERRASVKLGRKLVARVACMIMHVTLILDRYFSLKNVPEAFNRLSNSQNTLNRLLELAPLNCVILCAVCNEVICIKGTY